MTARRDKWLGKMSKKGIALDYDELRRKEAYGEALPWQEDLIQNDSEIMKQIESLIQNKDIVSL